VFACGPTVCLLAQQPDRGQILAPVRGMGTLSSLQPENRYTRLESRLESHVQVNGWKSGLQRQPSTQSHQHMVSEGTQLPEAVAVTYGAPSAATNRVW
jgi:hypothetical protein